MSLSAHTSQSHCRGAALAPSGSGLEVAVHPRAAAVATRVHPGARGEYRFKCRLGLPAERHRNGAAAWCSGRVVARAAAVGNAVAARQVIVIGAAVPLSRRPSFSARTRTPL